MGKKLVLIFKTNKWDNQFDCILQILLTDMQLKLQKKQ